MSQWIIYWCAGSPSDSGFGTDSKTVPDMNDEQMPTGNHISSPTVASCRGQSHISFAYFRHARRFLANKRANIWAARRHHTFESQSYPSPSLEALEAGRYAGKDEGRV